MTMLTAIRNASRRFVRRYVVGFFRHLFGADVSAVHEARTRIALSQMERRVEELMGQVNQTSFLVASEVRRLRWHEKESATLAHSAAKFNKMLRDEWAHHLAECHAEALEDDKARSQAATTSAVDALIASTKPDA